MSVPDALIGPIASLIGAITMAITWWASSKWGPGSGRDDDGVRRSRAGRRSRDENDDE